MSSEVRILPPPVFIFLQTVDFPKKLAAAAISFVNFVAACLAAKLAVNLGFLKERSTKIKNHCFINLLFLFPLLKRNIFDVLFHWKDI